MSNLLLALLKAVVTAMASLLTPVQVRQILDMAFDKIEDKVKASDSEWDDTLILPVVGALRTALNIPDEDA